MAALPPAANCVLVSLKGAVSTGKWQNNLYLQYSGTAPAIADLTTLATGISTAWSTNIAALAPTTVNLSTISLADLTSSQAAQTTVSITPIAGTRAGTANPNQVCCVVSWPINLRYRGGHPRSYMPLGVQADVTNGSFWTTTFHTAAVNGATAFRTALNALTTGATTYKLVAVSYYTNKQLRPQPLPITINPPVVHGRLDTQRGRLGRETP